MTQEQQPPLTILEGQRVMVDVDPGFTVVIISGGEAQIDYVIGGSDRPNPEFLDRLGKRARFTARVASRFWLKAQQGNAGIYLRAAPAQDAWPEGMRLAGPTGVIDSDDVAWPDPAYPSGRFLQDGVTAVRAGFVPAAEE